MKNAFIGSCYWFGNSLVVVVRLAVARWKVTGQHNVPRAGAFVLASNHMSLADPPLIACAMWRRRIRYMAKVEIFKPPFGVVPRMYGAFPVRRFGADASALMRAERILRAGHVVGMFPEGTRGRGAGVRPMQHGAALTALRTGSPILPCAIVGTDMLAKRGNLLRRPRIHVAFGAPIPVELKEAPDREALKDLTDRVQAAVAELYEEATASSIPATAVSGAPS